MERKLIKQGGGGLTIYVPKKWIDTRKLKEGDEVSIIEKENSLLISAVKKKEESSEITINDKNKKDLIPIITHLYRAGIDKIPINNL